ncbi:hypothetical protein QL285_031116 [Trifolium repens]|nr:hypothetical protein QL285_031116 [Trifolium repens]
MLSDLIKNAIQLYKENIARDRTIYLKFYSAYPDFSTRQQAKHFVYVGISNNNFPLMDEPTRKLYNEEEYNMILTNQTFKYIFAMSSNSKGVIYKSPS